MFKILKQDKTTNARTGILKTPHGNIRTPVFMPVGTLGTVKTTTPDELKDLGADIILGNTYHLYLRPGDDKIAKYGGLHEFIRWDRPILTDSGGYQVFSLAGEKSQKSSLGGTRDRQVKSQKLGVPPARSINNLVKISEEGIHFKSHLDGSKHFFTPEKVIDIQNNFGSDIMMVLDECAPYPCTEKYAREAMERTHRWAKQALKYHKSKPSTLNPKSLLFGIIQGSTFKKLRIESANIITSLEFDGIAIGGVAVGEGKKEMYEVLDWVMPIISQKSSLGGTRDRQVKSQKYNSKLKSKIENENCDIDNLLKIESLNNSLEIGNWKFEITGPPRPVYLMGVGTPEDLLEAVERGVDMFDCVLPTRLARHATVWYYPTSLELVGAALRGRPSQKGGKLNLLNSQFKDDKSVLMPGCTCYACRNGFSRAYIHHLLKENEVLGIRLTTLHNLHFLLDLMSKIRDNIEKENFLKFKKAFLKNWKI